MERNKKTLSLFILLPVLLLCRSDKCPSLPQNLNCYTDYNRIITCLWNSRSVSDDTACTIHAHHKSRYISYNASCDLKSVDISRPALKECSLIFEMEYTFLSFHVLSMNLSCAHMKQSLITLYKPFCHIKVNPPSKPEVNVTSVSWLSQDPEHERISSYRSELQWKQQDQSWSDPTVQKNLDIQCEDECKAELEPDKLIQGEKYEARVRVRSVKPQPEGAWSDWSPTASWESPVGKRKPPSGVPRLVVCIITAGVALMAVILCTTKKHWVYVVKTMKGQPIPDPGKSFLQNVPFKSGFTSEYFQSFLKPVEIITVELTSPVDAVVAYKPDEKMMLNKGSYDSTSSSFSNPSYSELCSPPPISSLTAGNLKPCAADTPYGPVGAQGEGKSTEQESDEAREKEKETLMLLLKGSSNSEPVQVISDYEKTERLDNDRFRLQSLDSGMCSCEEVSEESMEADSINMTDSHDEEPEGEEKKEGGNEQKADFRRLFGSSGGVFGKFIPVCSDYERVEKQQADSPELPSLDSGVSSGGEEQLSQDEGMEDADKSTESTRFLFPPHPSSALPCSLLSFPQLPLNLPGPRLSPAVQRQPGHMTQGFALMSAGRSVEPSGDGYMPVKQEEG
ncbi:interleukin-2 receptor subunit beta [Oreochromis niloticus]|uniref:interleukin-2 receptor subunit beta n=1 Tax=Oreochromis niloticus TaxID=8128 RepID=UPI0009055DF9|nr:interleukin-2 receptor subunit beta [Oreochromis niloticus]XP_019215883.1 interleukin-2 receptor subunit beta [Oreochromis niloticus]